MTSLLLFVAALGGIALVAVLTNKLTGTQAQYLEELRLAEGERVLWRGEGLDAYVIDRGPQALAQSWAHLGRHQAVLTSRRLLWGQRPLGGSRHMIERAVLFGRQAPGAEGLERADGGLLGGGYSVHLAEASALAPAADAKPGTLELKPLPTASSANIAAFRLFVPGAEALLAALAQVERGP